MSMGPDLRSQVETLRWENERLRERAEKAERERDELREQLARAVRGLPVSKSLVLALLEESDLECAVLRGQVERVKALAESRTGSGPRYFGGGNADKPIWPDQLLAALSLSPRRPAMSTDRESTEAEALADSIAGCLSNVSTLPDWMQLPALGRDTRPLLILAATGVLRSDWLAEHDRKVVAGAVAPILAHIATRKAEASEWAVPMVSVDELAEWIGGES